MTGRVAAQGQKPARRHKTVRVRGRRRVDGGPRAHPDDPSIIIDAAVVQHSARRSAAAPDAPEPRAPRRAPPPLNASVLGPVAASLEEAALAAHELARDGPRLPSPPSGSISPRAADIEASVEHVRGSEQFRFSSAREPSALRPQAPSNVRAPPCACPVQYLVNTPRRQAARAQSQPVVDHTEERLRLRHDLSRVLPFRANNFTTSSRRHTARDAFTAAIGCAEDAASTLMHEFLIDAIGAGHTVQIQGRVKSLWSLWNKMQKKGVPMEEVYDAIALRVVVSDRARSESQRRAIAVCYQMLAVVKRLWRPVKGELDDYICTPKASGYMSIHQAVLGPGGVPFEVQVRARRVRLPSGQVAERGVG